MLSDSLLGQLQTTLGDAYAIERELGGGGMSRVFVAREAALKRDVVIKVLAPELAGGVSLDRFQREIEVAARLQHPSIVPLLAAGESGGLPYYTMPFVAGESLRARLSREGELPVRDAVAILRDVSRALSYAHAHGVVHRDIKPDNVLLSGDYAVVTDFGVAKALSDALGDGENAAQRSTLTALGVALGTPAYMAPEQSAGDPSTDHRADIYAFGVMAYEMLAGETPFSARSPQAMLAAHATETPAPLAVKRPAVPPALSALVMRCLEKRPADRPQSADEIVQTLDAATTPHDTAARPTSWARRRTGARVGMAAIGFLVLALLSYVSLRARRGPEQPLNQNVIAVLPFRVTSADRSVRSLREGIVDLISAKLTGTLRTADTRTALAAWRGAGGGDDVDLDEARSAEAMRKLGAGRMLAGEILDAAGALTIHGSLVDLRTPTRRVSASVSGRADALPALLDTLVATLLLRDAGETERAAATLARIPLPALQAYVAGERLYRLGLYDKAGVEFARAVEVDSTFALAGLRLLEAAGWSLNARHRELGARIARAHVADLSPVDRLILDDAAPVGVWSCAGKLAQEERATELAPESPNVWYRLADNLWHCGAEMGMPDAMSRSLAGFNRALALDSSFAPAREHLPATYAMLGDTATARRLMALIPDTSDMYSLNEMTVFQDSASQSDALRRMAASPVFSFPGFAVGVFQYWNEPTVATAEEMLRSAGKRAVTEADRRQLAAGTHEVAIAEGQPSRAVTALEAMGNPPETAVLDAIFGDGDSTAAHRALPRLDEAIGSAPAGADAEQAWLDRVFSRGEYDLAQGSASPVARRAADRLRTFASGSAYQVVRARLLASVLDAHIAVIERRPDARRVVESADSALRQVYGDALAQSIGNLVAIRLWERLGDTQRAYAATHRLPVGPRQTRYIATFTRERARLAAATGDLQAAIREYRRYIVIRAQAEPALVPDRENAKRELARLEKQTAGR